MSKRNGIILSLVMAFVVMILLVQLWLFTEAVESASVQNGSQVLLVAVIMCSGLSLVAAWKLISSFLAMETEG